MTTATIDLTFAGARTALAEGLRTIEEGQAEFDLANLAAVDSASVAVLLAWQRAALAKGLRLRLANPPKSLLSLASLYGVSELLSLEEASPD